MSDDAVAVGAYVYGAVALALIGAAGIAWGVPFATYLAIATAGLAYATQVMSVLGSAAGSRSIVTAAMAGWAAALVLALAAFATLIMGS